MKNTAFTRRANILGAPSWPEPSSVFIHLHSVCGKLPGTQTEVNQRRYSNSRKSSGFPYKHVTLCGWALSNILTQPKQPDQNNETGLTPRWSPLCLLFYFELKAHMLPSGIWKNIRFEPKHHRACTHVRTCIFWIRIPFYRKDFERTLYTPKQGQTSPATLTHTRRWSSRVCECSCLKRNGNSLKVRQQINTLSLPVREGLLC